MASVLNLTIPVSVHSLWMYWCGHIFCFGHVIQYPLSVSVPDYHLQVLQYQSLNIMLLTQEHVSHLYILLTN
jgi:hypothetical protein